MDQSLVALATSTRQHPQDEMEPTQMPYSHTDDMERVHSALATVNNKHEKTVFHKQHTATLNGQSVPLDKDYKILYQMYGDSSNRKPSLEVALTTSATVFVNHVNFLIVCYTLTVLSSCLVFLAWLAMLQS